MSAWLQVVLLAVVQGLTEFLPVSSSGHLVLTEEILGFNPPGVVLELMLHLGTLLAVVLYYRRDLWTLFWGLLRALGGRRGWTEKVALELGLLLVVGTVPAVVAALLFEDRIEAAFSDPKIVCGFLVVTGLLLLSTLLARRGTRLPGVMDALVMGLFQAASLLPGISRSGSTISGGLFRGLRPEEAARFSFLLSVPAILGAAVFHFRDLSSGLAGSDARLLGTGFAVSFLVGYASIEVLLRIVRRGSFAFFGVYCVVVGGTGLVWFFTR